MERPNIQKGLSSSVFLQYYYLKEELIAFCRQENLPVSGGKVELTKRIAAYLDSGVILKASTSSKSDPGVVTKDTIIIEHVRCSEELRAFFKREIGPSFHFNVSFQQWLKTNVGKTYEDAIAAYQALKRNPQKTKIDKQFEYNTYIRDFFEDNPDLSLKNAITCWKYKKRKQGSHRYERSDLQILK